MKAWNVIRADLKREWRGILWDAFWLGLVVAALIWALQENINV